MHIPQLFRVALPQIAVVTITPKNLKKVDRDIRQHGKDYFGTSRLGVQNLTLNKHGMWEFSLLPDDFGKYEKEYVVKPGHVLVISTNGRRYIGPDDGISDGNFGSIPAELFHPNADNDFEKELIAGHWDDDI
jgi:hypothetical protein